MSVVTILRNHASSSAKKLAIALGARCAYVDSERRCGCHRYVINWGVAAAPRFFRQGQLTYSSNPQAAATCRDKIATFRALNNAQVSTLEWSVTSDAARPWLATDGKIVVRATATGHSGAGITIVRQAQAGQETRIPQAPLYTRYWRKDCEFRVHVAFGRVILIQQKRRRNGHAQGQEDHLIRTYDNGYVFAVNQLSCDDRGYRQALEQLALDATRAVGAGHCAVDILVRHPSRRDNSTRMTVCEINSAPALDAESSLNAYVEAFRRDFLPAQNVARRAACG